jgi:hypothetical protein
MGTSSSPRLRADVFPSTVVVSPPNSPSPASTAPGSQLLPDQRRLEKVRIVVTLEQVLIFQDSSSGPQLIFSEALLDYAPPTPMKQTLRNMYAHREATLTTESGKTLAFFRSTGCGCGSRLKSFRPFGETTSYSVASTLDTTAQSA